MSIQDRLQQIEYQILNNLSFTPTDEQYVMMANSILRAQLILAKSLGEDIVDTTNNPTTFLGATITWDEANPEGDSYTIELNGVTITQDADDPVALLVNPNDGIDDAEAVALDKASLQIGLGTNSDLHSVESNLTFPSTGSNGTVVTWDTSALSSIDNSGVVTQGVANETGYIVATIAKGSDSDTKSFHVTILQDADAAAVSADKASLEIGLNDNIDLNSVETYLTFPLTGANGTTISWDASGMASIDNVGAVTRPTDANESGVIVATISKGTVSDTKIFNVTVLKTTSVPFITTWQTDATGAFVFTNSDQARIPLDSEGTYNFTVDWGDGNTNTITSWDQVLDGETTPVTHTYTSAGTYDITINGQCEGWGFASQYQDNSKIIGIKQWGNMKLHNKGKQFAYCDNLNSYTATDVLDTSNVTDMNIMFYQTIIPVGFDISGWDTSNVVSMGNMFDGATIPVGFDISGWDTSSVMSMNYTFKDVTIPSGFDISSWNTSNVANMRGAFNGATLPTGFDISFWNTSSVTDMYMMFHLATIPSGFDISGWNTSSVTNMTYLFSQAIIPAGFDISGWDTSSVTDMYGMFSITTLPDGFDISGWDTSSVIDMDRMFLNAVLPTNFDLSGWCVPNIASEPSLFGTFNGTTQLKPIWGTCPNPDAFITTWQTDAAGTVTSGTDQIKLPLDSGGTYNFTVQWGDGTQDTITSYNQPEVTHTYIAVGSYDITIDGTCEGWGFTWSGEDNSKLTGIKQWGSVKLHNDGAQLCYCNNLSSYTATDTLDVSNITIMEGMFHEVTFPTGFDISGWDTSSVEDIHGMFYNTTIPTGFDISGWNTSSVINMMSAFRYTTLPTGFDISGWDTSSVNAMKYLFDDATLPSGFDISTWDTSNVLNMDGMFRNVALPDPFDLSGWCVPNIPWGPPQFGTFNGTTQLQPIWGTCPGV